MVEQSKNPVTLTALPVADLAKILASAYGRKITEEQVREVAETGGLIRADGTVNLIQYAAFLAKEITGADED